MRYKSCQFVNHYLGFNDSRIVYCTLGNTAKNKQYAVLKENYNGEPIDWDELLDKIESDKQSHKNGKIIDSCKDCMMLREEDWDTICEPRKFKYVLFSNWYACNSACSYCWKDGEDFLIEDVDSKKIDPNDTYDIIPIVKDLIEKKLLAEDALVDFAGGEPTMYYKFYEALNMLIDANVKHFIINTNAINYSEGIERAVKEGVADLMISVDAGTKEIHQKVKRVVSFDRVLKNLARYCNALQPHNTNKVRSKYIIIPHVNDIEDEIIKWIYTAKEMHVSELVLNADDRMYMTEPNIDDFKRVKELCDFFIKEVKKADMRYLFYSNACNAYTTLGLPLPQYKG